MSAICRNIHRRNLINVFINYGRISSVGHSRAVENPTAGIIIIGDEILKAQVKDTNSHYMCSRLYDCGVKVKKISVVSDQVDRIADEVVNFSKQYTYVITSGGIGPTHDDVTFEGVAKAFGDSLSYHPKLVEVVRNFSTSQDLSSPGYKLANIPASASLKFGRVQEPGQSPAYPCINVKNVYVFPGSPIFLQRIFGSVFKELFGTGKNFVTRELYLGAREELFADALSAVVREFPNVTFGSYPAINNSYYSARVTIESSSKDETNKAIERFRELAPSNSVLNYDSDPLKKFDAFVSTDKKEFYDNPRKVAICLETTVLIHFAHTCYLLGEKDRISVYLKGEKPSEEIVARYDSEFHSIEGPVRRSIEEIGTLILGLKGDKTKGGPWHALASTKRVCHVRVRLASTEWTHKTVWNFAGSLGLLYSKLYDRGYTSLESREETQPNSNLFNIKDGERS